MTTRQFDLLTEKQQEFIEELDRRMRSRLSRVSSQLFERIDKEILSKLETDADGNILRSPKNMALINKIVTIMPSIDLSQFAKLSIADYLTIIPNSSPYFEAFDIERQRIEAIEKSTLPKMMKRAKVFNKMSVRRKDAIRARKVIVKEMLKGKNYVEMKKDIKNWVVKDGKALSHIKTELNDAFMEGDRYVVEQMARGLDLDRYYRFAGSLVQRSRDFCEHRNRKAYTKNEVEAWRSLTWEGKSSPYDPYINVGGYNCRHRLMPISEGYYNRLKTQGY